MPFSKADKIAHINKSPESVAIHDKEQWLSIFSQYSIVEDPVGSKPHVNGLYDKHNKARGNGALSRFYETFIAPNKIVFDVNKDIVCNNHVVRDLTVNINMSGVNVSVPMHLLYELTEENKELKIHRLAAHWELVPMLRTLMDKGTDALPVVKTLSTRMLKYQGVSGAMGFMAGVGKLGNHGKDTLEDFFDAFNGKNEFKLKSLFSPAAIIHAPYGKLSCSPQELLQEIAGEFTFNKVLTAGYAVSTSVKFETTTQGKTKRKIVKEGVAIFEFDTKSKKIDRLSFYYE